MHTSPSPLTHLTPNYSLNRCRIRSARGFRTRASGLRGSLGLLQAVFLTAALPLTAQAATEAERFAELETLPWSTVLEYEGGPLGEDWWVEGDPEAVVGQEDRLLFKTGDAPQPTGLPAVLWAEPVIEGDVRVDFTFTRLWDQDQGGNTLFLLASGLGTGAAPVDLKESAEERTGAALP